MSKINIGQLMIEIGMRDNFSSEMKRLNKEIRGLEKELRSMDKEFKNYGKTVDGLAEKQKILSQAIEKSQSKQMKLVQERDVILKKYREEQEELQRVKELYGENSDDYKKVTQSMLDSANQINKINDQLDSTARTTRRNQAELQKVTQEYNRVANGIQTYDEKLETIKNNTEELTEELELEQKILNAQGKTWKEYNNVVQQTATKLEASREAYKTHREELNRLSQEEERVTRLKEENARVLAEEEIKLKQIAETLGVTSSEYYKQNDYVKELRNNNRQYVESLTEMSTQHEKVNKSLRESKREYVDNVIAMKELGSNKTTQFLKNSSNVISGWGESLQGTSVASGAFVAGSASVFMEFETGQAKIKTLLKDDVGELDRISKECIRISNETGQSIGTIMEGAYTALSSGVAPNEVVSFIEVASKMATAGATTTDNTVRLLSQVQNTYGDKAFGGDYNKVADFFTAIQDEGVISIEQLSEVMSESLAIGSAYGVQIQDIGTAITMATLQGSSAHEAGTNMSNLLQELGDSNSKVAEIIKNKTGKSFSELAKEGWHLDDILAVVKEHADETGVEFGSLFGSANAGIIAMQMLNTQNGTFDEVMQRICGTTGLVDKNFNTLSDTAQFKLSSSLNTLKNSLIEIGGSFAPIIDVVSKVISGFAKGIDALPNGIKGLIGVVTGLTAVASPFLTVGAKIIDTLAQMSEIKELGGLKNIFSDVGGFISGDSSADKISNTIRTEALKKEIADTESQIKKLKQQGVEYLEAMDTLGDGVGLFGDEAKEYNAQMGSLRAGFNETNDDIDRLERKLITANEALEATSGATTKVADTMGDVAQAGSKSTGILGKLGNLMAKHPMLTAGVAIAGTAVAIYGATKAYEMYYNASHKASIKQNEINESMKEHQETIKGLTEEKSYLDGIIGEYDTLSKKTKLSAEESERLKQIYKEVAEINPNWVEYDANGDPIGIKIDLVKEYQEELQTTIDMQNELLRGDIKANAENSTDLYHEQAQDIQQQTGKTKIAYDKWRETVVNPNTGASVDNWTQFYDKDIKEREKYLDEFDKIYKQQQDAIQNDINARATNSKANKDYLKSEMDNTATIKNLGEEQKKTYDSFMENMDFSGIDGNRLASMLSTITQSFGEMDAESAKTMQNIIKNSDSLYTKWKEGKISSEEYTKQIDVMAQEMSELLGITPEEAKQMLLPIEFDAESANKVIADIDKTKADLQRSLLGFETENLTTEAKVRMLVQMQQDENTPQVIKDEIDKILADEKVTDAEIETLVKMTAELDEEDAHTTVNTKFDKFKDDLEGQDKKVQQNVILEYATKVENEDDLFNYIEELSGESVAVNILTNIKTGDLEGLKQNLASLPTEQQIGIITSIKNTGSMSNKELISFIDSLPEEVRTQVWANANFKDLLEEKKQLKEDTTSTHKTTSDNTEVTTDKQSNQQPTSNTHKVNADNTSVQTTKQSNQQQTSNTHKVNAENSSVQQTKQSNQQQTGNTHKIDADNREVTTAKSNNEKDTSSTHTITVRQVIQNVVNFFKGGSSKSVNAPRVVEEDVIVKSNISAPRIVDLANEMSTADNEISNVGNSIRANMDNVVSAMAKSVNTYADSGYTIRALESDVDLLTNLSAVIDKLTSSLSKLESQQERTWGSSKTKLLQQEISLLQEQQRLTKATENNMKQMADYLRGSLRDKGFSFNDDGSISNYNTKLISMTENVEKLKKKMDDYKGEDEKHKDKLSKAYNDANDALSKTKEQLDEYLNLTFNEMPNAQAEWEDLTNQIADAKAEIIEATHEARVFSDVIRSELQEAVLEKFDTQIDILDIKMDLGGFDNQIVYIREQIDLMNQAMEKTEGLIGSMTNQRNWAKDTLLNQSFEFDHDGNIKNAESRLKKLRDTLSTAEYEAIKEIYDEYVDLHYSTLPDLEKQWLDYKSSIKEAEKEIEELEKEIKELKSNAKLDTLEQSFEHLNEELSILEAKFDNAISTKDKSKLLMEQLRLIQRIKTEQQSLTEEYRNQADILKRDLATYGIKFDYDGSINNLEQIMNSLGNVEDMEALQDLADSYNDMLSNMNDGTAEIEALENQMSELRDEMLSLQKEFENFKIDTWTQKLENGLKILENDLEKLQNSADLTNTNMINNWNQQVDKINELRNKTAEMISFYKQRKNQLQQDLVDFGFRFSDDGSISNYYEQLTQLKNAMTETSFDLLNESLEEYFDISLDTIPELENQLIDFKKELEDIAEEKLDITKDIEDEITKVYEDEIEKRIEEIEKEKDARIEALEKAKEEYEKFRDEADYEDSYNEQLKSVQELQSKVEVAKRDTSLSGQKRLQELMEQLEEEQKSLQDLVRDKVDSDIQDMFDSEMDRLETNAEKEIEEIEELWSASKVAEAVQQALATGIFEDIDGNIMALDKALMDFANSSEEYFGVMGDKLKSELVSNLQTALGVVQELDKAISKIDYDSVRFAGVGYNAQAMASTTNNTTNNTNNNNNVTVELNPTYHITATNSTLDEQAILDVLEQSKDDMMNEIEHNILKYVK